MDISLRRISKPRRYEGLEIFLFVRKVGANRCKFVETFYRLNTGAKDTDKMYVYH